MLDHICLGHRLKPSVSKTQEREKKREGICNVIKRGMRGGLGDVGEVGWDDERRKEARRHDLALLVSLCQVKKD